MSAKQSGFQGKSIIFVTSISIPKAPMGRGWADIYLIKGVSGALVLTIRELRKLICQSRTKQQETSHGCVLYTALIGFDCILHSLSSWGYYILTHTWGFRRCSFRLTRAMRRPTNRGASDRLAPRSFVLYIQSLINNFAVVAKQPS